jgi:hypothetical protein
VKRALVLVPLLFAVLWLPTSANAGVAVASVTFVNAITFDSESDFPLTVCLDGVAQGEELSTGTALGPVDIAPGEYDVAFVQGGDCSDEDPFAEGTVTFAPDANVTVMGFWGSDGRGVVSLPNDTSCIDSGLSRFTFRHAAATDAVDVTVTPASGAPIDAATGLEVGQQAITDLPSGDYTGGAVTATSDGDPIAALGAATLADGESRTAYLFGGADGDIGIFFTPVVQLEVCAAPPSSSTTTTPAVQAATQPKFTG